MAIMNKSVIHEQLTESAKRLAAVRERKLKEEELSATVEPVVIPPAPVDLTRK